MRLYESICDLDEFTSSKYEIMRNGKFIGVDTITLHYDNEEVYSINLNEENIKSFNVFDNRGYCIADLGFHLKQEEFFKCLITDNRIKKLILKLSDNSTEEYYILWSSNFHILSGSIYIMLFESKEPIISNE